jgi:urea transport system substrate-binding protein
MSTARLRWLSVAAAVLAIVGSGLNSARAEDTIKIGILHSLSGTMAISETILKDLMLMEVADAMPRAGYSARRSNRWWSIRRRTGRCLPKRRANC